MHERRLACEPLSEYKVIGVAVYGEIAAATRLRIGRWSDPAVEIPFSYSLATFLDSNETSEWLQGGIRRLQPLLSGLRRLWRHRQNLLGNDLAIIQREAMPFNFLGLERGLKKRGIPFIWDIDDSPWRANRGLRGILRGPQRKYAWLARNAQEVWAGNEFLAEWARHQGARYVRLVPTTTPQTTSSEDLSRVDDLLVWVGTQSSSVFLENLLWRIPEAFLGWSIRVVGANVNAPASLDVTCLPWTEENQRRALHEGALGIYPLDQQHPMTEGKSAFKSVLYLAAGIAFIAAGSRAVQAVARNGEGCYIVHSEEEWALALDRLRSKSERDRLAALGRVNRHRFDHLDWTRVLTSTVSKILGIQDSTSVVTSLAEGPLLAPPLVSVVIPVHNGERWLESTLRTVRDQTYENWELIIVDDRSTDTTPEIARQFAASVQQEVRVIQSSAPGGAAARNTGMRNAQGVFLALLDADDLWRVDKLAIQIQALLDSPNLVGFGSGYVFLESPGENLSGYVDAPWTEEMLQSWFSMLSYGPALNSTLMLRTDVVRQGILYDESMRFGEDLDFAWRLKQIGQVGFSPQALTAYRLWSGQIHSNWQMFAESSSYTHRKHLGSDVEQIERLDTYRSVHVALRVVRAGNVTDGIRMLVATFFSSPALTLRCTMQFPVRRIRRWYLLRRRSWAIDRFAKDTLPVKE